MTTYNSTIPKANDLISVSQGDILGNFAQLNTQFGIDHTAFDTGSGNGDGFHKQVTFPTPLGADPVGLTGTQGVIYPKAVSSLGQLFFANSTTVSQLTGIAISADYSTTGFSMTTPWGITIKFGLVSIPGASTPIVYTTAFPTQCFAFVCSPKNTTPSYVVSAEAVSNTGATVYSAANGHGGQSAYYFAIGN